MEFFLNPVPGPAVVAGSAFVEFPTKKRALEADLPAVNPPPAINPSNPKNRKGGKAWGSDNDPNLDEKVALKNGSWKFSYKKHFPVYKYGFDKFVCFYLHDVTSELVAFMGDFAYNSATGEWAPDDTKRSIRMTERQFMRLSSNILSGNTEIYRDATATPDNENLSAYLSLSGDMYFVWINLTKKPMASIRRIVETNTGDLIPSRDLEDRLTMSAFTWDAFRKQVLDGSLLRYAAGVIEQGRERRGETRIPLMDPQDCGEFSDLKRAVANAYFESIQDYLVSKCDKCIEMRLVYDSTKRRDKKHSCHWGLTKFPLSHSMRKDTVKRLVASNKVVGK